MGVFDNKTAMTYSGVECKKGSSLDIQAIGMLSYGFKSIDSVADAPNEGKTITKKWSNGAS